MKEATKVSHRSAIGFILKNMIKDYTYIKQQIARSKGSFQMDCCKMSTELFWFKWKNVVTSHDMYQDLLGMIAKKLKLKIEQFPQETQL